MLEILAGGGTRNPAERTARKRNAPPNPTTDAQDLAARPAALSGGRRTHILAANPTLHLSKSFRLVIRSAFADPLISP